MRLVGSASGFARDLDEQPRRTTSMGQPDTGQGGPCAGLCSADRRLDSITCRVRPAEPVVQSVGRRVISAATGVPTEMGMPRATTRTSATASAIPADLSTDDTYSSSPIDQYSFQSISFQSTPLQSTGAPPKKWTVAGFHAATGDRRSERSGCSWKYSFS